MRVRCGRNGISFRFGKETVHYKNYETGDWIGEEIIAWFNVENPSYISVTDLKEQPQSLFSVEREIRVPGMDAPAEVLRGGPWRKTKPTKPTAKVCIGRCRRTSRLEFAGRMFRQNLV